MAGDQDTHTLTTGVVVRLKPPAPLAMAQAMTEVGADEPKAPMVFNADQDRDVENKADPDFLRARREWLARAGLRTFQALVAPNTVVVSYPDDLIKPDDEDYDDYMESMGFEPAKGKYTRHSQWLRFVACGKDDIRTLTTALFRAAGVSEEDVAEAQQLFRSDEERIPDNGTSANPGTRSRDKVLPSRSGDGA